MLVRVILQACYIPDDTFVYKPTGHSRFVLKRKLPIYGDGAKNITVDDGVVFMTSESGVNIIRNEKMLAVEDELDTIIAMLHEIKGDYDYPHRAKSEEE